MRKVIISSEKIMAMTREYLRESGFDLTNGNMLFTAKHSGDKIIHYEIVAILPNEKPDLKLINGKL